MPEEITLAGFTITRDEWDALEPHESGEMLYAAGPDEWRNLDPAAWLQLLLGDADRAPLAGHGPDVRLDDEPYESYEILY